MTKSLPGHRVPSTCENASIVEPEAVRAWIGVLRDLAIMAIGGFMLIHETIGFDPPSEIVVVAGLLMLGIPPALRVDHWLQKRNGNGQ